MSTSNVRSEYQGEYIMLLDSDELTAALKFEWK